MTGRPARTTPRTGGRPTTVRSLATFVPPRVLTNADLEKMVDTSDEWITARTGIKTRRIADDQTATSDLAAEAGRRAISPAASASIGTPRILADRRTISSRSAAV